jgi:FAD/FMN-containing dehydrogenase
MWRNWAGNVECHPRALERPRTEPDVVALVEQAARDGGSVRVAGAGHSFTPLCATDGMLISLDGLQGLDRVTHAPASSEATLWAGTRMAQMGEPLRAAGVALDTQGDVDYQALAGAISTGTHGTGTGFGSLSSRVTELRLVLASGDIVTCSPTADPELFRAAQVSLGLLGIVTQITMRVVPAFRLHERTWLASFEEMIEQLDGLIHGNEHFEFFWLPRHDLAAMKALNTTTAAPSGAMPSTSAAAPGTPERYVQPERVDWSYRIFPSPRTVPFVEMEFAVPFSQGPDCLRELRELMRTDYPQVTWAVEYRTQQADDMLLSPAYARDSVTISVHESPDHPYHAFFAAAEAVFRNHGGRPHWGKLHTLRARELRALYPQWDHFQAIRARVDPAGRFLTPYLRRLVLDD